MLSAHDHAHRLLTLRNEHKEEMEYDGIENTELLTYLLYITMMLSEISWQLSTILQHEPNVLYMQTCYADVNYNIRVFIPEYGGDDSRYDTITAV